MLIENKKWELSKDWIIAQPNQSIELDLKWYVDERKNKIKDGVFVRSNKGDE